MIDELVAAIEKLRNPSVAGIDTAYDYLPEEMRRYTLPGDVGKSIAEFNRNVVDAICGVVPAVKVQAAYYEMYGLAGMRAFADTLQYAKSRGLIVIADVKRNDIGSTAACYAKAYLERGGDFASDFITVNGYLGGDGIAPFVQACKQHGKGIFVLAKTSNPTSGEFQNRRFEDGDALYEAMGKKVAEWGKELTGECGYSDVGAVVGATHPAEAERLRKALPGVFFLVPGYGAQGGKAEDLTVCFDARGRGAIVNSSRGILLAYRKETYKGMTYGAAARAACIDMAEDIRSALNAAGKNC